MLLFKFQVFLYIKRKKLLHIWESRKPNTYTFFHGFGSLFFRLPHYVAVSVLKMFSIEFQIGCKTSVGCLCLFVGLFTPWFCKHCKASSTEPLETIQGGSLALSLQLLICLYGHGEQWKVQDMLCYWFYIFKTKNTLCNSYTEVVFDNLPIL